MYYIPFATIVIIVIASGSLADDCGGADDGTVLDWACTWFTRCSNGEAETVDCDERGLVYNPDREKCDQLVLLLTAMTDGSHLISMY